MPRYRCPDTADVEVVHHDISTGRDVALMCVRLAATMQVCKIYVHCSNEVPLALFSGRNIRKMSCKISAAGHDGTVLHLCVSKSQFCQCSQLCSKDEDLWIAILLNLRKIFIRNLLHAFWHSIKGDWGNKILDNPIMSAYSRQNMPRCDVLRNQ